MRKLPRAIACTW